MNKIAVVTGAASGIGRAVVERLSKEDVFGVILDIDNKNGQQVAGEVQRRGKQAAFMCVDVTQEGTVRAAFDRIISDHGRLDVLVNVAGGS
ncbi:MAG: SDR family NAD(P)-dependent oxidoreductase, partial [Deltaproteobacteria bacterium]|nr:SDR family NAD(P)-dependent oxidoreductase [Deltaproteobacteria bacterium]